MRRIPDVSDNEAKEAVGDVANAKDIATKDYIDAAIMKVETELKYMRWVLGVLVLGNLAVIGILVRLFFYLISISA